MKTFEIEMLLIGMAVSALIWTLFIYFGKRVLGFLETQPKPGHCRRNPGAVLLKTESLRRKIETKPNVICSLPIHQAGRPEAPLS